MVVAADNRRHDAVLRASQETVMSLPVVGSSAGAIRPSRMSRRRAISLVIIHLLIIGHVIHWRVAGRTLSPVEPSEAMYTLNDGHLNAGFIFFAVALAATLLLGRFVCGWGCHLIAYQDLCAHLLKKIGIKPKPFRSRILVLAPLALALYMFVWPTVYRWWVGAPRPPLTNHMMKTAFWETLPGPVIAILTIFVCGFVAVYFLGSKGFCTYACPYGGFFREVEKLAPGRILVTDACQHCGHCTARCTSNVRVHEEVALYGMVVDPGCMKCMDCVSVCPNNALYFGFARPSLFAKPPLIAKTPLRSPLTRGDDPPVSPLSKGGQKGVRNVPYDFALWEEGLMVVVGVAAVLAFRGLYGQIPLLLAMAMAGVTAYLAIKFIRLVRTSNVRLQNLQLKRGGRLTRAGIALTAMTVTFFAFTAHSAAVQYHAWRGRTLLKSLAIGDEVWSAESHWWDKASPEQRSGVETVMNHLQRADHWGLMSTPTVLQDLVWLYLAKERTDEAATTVRRLIDIAPDQPDPYRGLAGVMRKTGRIQEAQKLYHQALMIDPSFTSARNDLCAMLVSTGHHEDAIAVYRDAISLSPYDSHWRMELGRLLMDLGRFSEAKAAVVLPGADVPDSACGYHLFGLASLQLGQFDEGIKALRQAIKLDPSLADAHYNLGMALLDRREIKEAIGHLQDAVKAKPDFALAHYNLGVATFMAGRPAEALPHIREAIHLQPDDPDAHGFLAVVLRELSDTTGAQEAAAQVDRLRGKP